MGKKNLIKKGLAIVLSAATVLGIMPSIAGNLNTVQAAENQLPSIKQFATVEELKTFDTNDKDEDGKNPAKVYFGKGNQQWWIAGSQGGDSLTLFAASPLETCQKLKIGVAI